MIYQETFKTGLKDFGKNSTVKNKAILEIFENIGAYHSDAVGYGAKDLSKTGVTWILLDWKIKTIRRPEYGEVLTVKTWGRNPTKFSIHRDYELYDDKGNLCVIGTSKWVLIDINKGKLTRITQEILDSYEIETKCVFENPEIEKIEIPQEFEKTMLYTVNRKDIDINKHMHNLYYLDLAYEALPDEAYENRPYNNVRITYKKEIKFGETVECKYVCKENKHVVVIQNKENDTINAVIELYN